MDLNSLTEKSRQELQRAFRPEFLNRLDEIVLFKPLTMGEIEEIVEFLCKDLQVRLSERGITVELSSSARTWLARKGFDPVYGARPLRRIVQREIETRIGRSLIAGEIPEGTCLRIEVEEGGLVVSPELDANGETGAE